MRLIPAHCDSGQAPRRADRETFLCTHTRRVSMRFKSEFGLAGFARLPSHGLRGRTIPTATMADTFMDIEGVVKEVHPGRPAFLGLPGSQGRQRRAANLGSRSNRPDRARENWSHCRLH